MTVKTAGKSYLEHWRDDMIERRREHRDAMGDDTTLGDFNQWHKETYGHGTHFGSWMENERHKLDGGS